jgi:hypothetical protein
MPEVNATIPTGALRVVLFGMPDAGKSSLLGALAQAAQTQEHALAGHLLDSTKGLTDLQQRVYEDRPQQTLQEIVPYPVVYEPTDPGHAGERLNAVLIDSDGRVANDLLARLRPWDDSGKPGPLEQALLGADAIVLAVDASASAAQMEADFAQFTRFLRLLEQNRGEQTAVAGLPVFLVLTKCDRLAHPGDAPTAWIDALQVKKQEVAQRFRDFLAREQADNKPVPFGSIDLHVEATAVKRPDRPRDPYGVAELFRDCFDEAEEFRGRRGRSNRRLFLTVAGSALALTGMGLLAGFLLGVRQANAPTDLQLEVSRYLAADQDQTPAARHHNIKKRIDELSAFANNPDFGRLPTDMQDRVHALLDEARAYQAFENELSRVPDPATVRSEAKLKDVENDLARLHRDVPLSYQADWSETPAYRQLAERLDDVDAIAKAVKELRQGYRAVIDKGEDVIRRENEIVGLPRRAREILDQARELPTPEDRDRPLSGSRRVTYGTVFGFPDVLQLYQRWDQVRKQLERYAPRPCAVCRFERPVTRVVAAGSSLRWL